MERNAPAGAEIKARQTKHWNAVAPGWAAWYDWTARNFAPLTRWLREAAGWKPGLRLLDVASGSGYPALDAARSVQPGGQVVAIDISPAMTSAAAQAANAAGVENLQCLVMDAEELRFETVSFDAVSNTYGLMFCPDPQRASDEMHRVLKPGGRVAVVVWDEPAKSPFFAVISSVAAAALALPAPEAGTPGPFRLASAAELESLLVTSGFSDVRVESRSMTFEFGSVDDYCQIFTDVAWKARMSTLSPRAAAAFRESVAEAVRPDVREGRLQLVATSLCASGRKRTMLGVT